MRRALSPLFLILWLSAGSLLSAAELHAGPEDEVFAALTLKEGLASGFAHNHLIVAPHGRFVVKADGKQAERYDELQLAFESKLVELIVDDKDDQATMFAVWEKLGVLKEPFSAVEDDDRKKIRDAMLGDAQLAAEKFPTIAAKVFAIRANPHKVAETAFTHSGKLEVTLHGKTVVSEAHLILSGTTSLRVTGFAALQFTDFNIQPFSAYLGAVRVQNPFFLYVATTVAS